MIAAIISTWALLCLCLVDHTSSNLFKTSQDLAVLLRTLECEYGDTNEAKVQEILTKFDVLDRHGQSKQASAEWNYVTDMTPENSKKMIEATVENSNVMKRITAYAVDVQKRKEFQCYSDDTRRRIELYTISATAKNSKVTRRVNELKNSMLDIYNNEKYCMKGGKCEKIEPDLERIMMNKDSPAEVLLETWKGARDAVGPKIGNIYPEFVKNINTGAKDNGFSDFGEYWRTSQFGDTDGLIERLEELWNEIKPLYQQLHAYVHRKLIDKHGAEIAGELGHGIPAHLLGNMWAQQWSNIYDIVAPFPEIEVANITEALVENHYDVDRIFKTAEEFFESLGLFPMTDTFWEKSIRSEPKDGRAFVCHGSASDMFRKGDFRIKMCTDVNAEDFEVVHHEMGHIEYFMAYEDQPTVYRTGANSGFHEAVGDTVTLSVRSQKHLEKIGLMKKSMSGNSAIRKKREINTLMKMALDKIAFIPFGYLMDKWRWDVFSGKIQPKDYNKSWWDLRLKYQGIVSPVPRSDRDFDPGSKFHIPDNDYYIAYFISFITQFQFYEALCDLSHHSGPLHECDFYGSTEAGDKFKEMLSFGASKPWPETLEFLTGKDRIDTGSIRKYFKPLTDWLEVVNSNTSVGWDKAVVNWEVV